ncbi:phosphotransferase enzyme family-domain-containing protein [Russula ochroleuca]|jgi:aminoglycoside phosphotransferase (APT) family kinase protein|uniref:Phosphotransferase enzyme family-domain-containing protein n=1 Tax=Russula ochroleuca TaxID=152965 RepID=A0A9P5MRC0_9AGAM|nr:phosphotransferase enzyme family-domain-containing protein [Russula ochroleuca]
MSPSPPQHGLEWKYELFDVIPSWTVEPDMAVAKAIAIRHLPVTPSSYEITFFSAGAFNKLFLLQPLGNSGANPESFILRVILPVDPYFKTASEVATLQFVRKNTPIPVPRVIAFDSSADNELGFEWILMTKLPGVTLKSLWESSELEWESRSQLTKTLAGYVKQLTSFKFPVMGNMYPSNRPEFERISWLKHLSSETRFVPLPDNAEFAIGPVATIPFFYGDRLRLQNGRGPFQTSSSYLTSLLRLHISSTTNRKSAVSTDDEYEEDDISEFEDAISAYESLLSVLPIFFPREASGDAETFSLFHDDISSDNILVDPTTHRITGIVDWECVSLQPRWEVAARVPQLLEGPEVEDGAPIPDAAPPSEEGADEFHKELRERHEQMLLRRIYYDEMGGKPEHGSRERLFENKLQQVDVRPTAVRNWANGILHEVQLAITPETE